VHLVIGLDLPTEWISEKDSRENKNKNSKLNRIWTGLMCLYIHFLVFYFEDREMEQRNFCHLDFKRAILKLY
jgi:hypothetical protein